MDGARGNGTGAAATGKVRIRDILAIREIRVVVVATFVVMLGYGILSPVLPLYARSFGVGYDAVGLLVSAFALTRLVFDLVAGPLVTRFGERKVVTTGAAVVGLSSAAAALAPNFPLLVAFRAAGGAGSSVFFAGLMSYLLRTAPPDRLGRVMGVFYGAFNVGVILGNPVGGVVAHFFGLAGPLWFYAAACFLAAAMYLR
ncbi:MAG TPA: MFS transporter, partial [Actinomycetota bacterium]|nr:MFS transporter [Actinomycetota bacterium]